MRLEQTYTLRQTYLNEIKYKPTLNAIDENTSSAQIGKYIEEELVKPTQEKLASDRNSLHEQLEHIVYLNKLSYYYAYYVSSINSYNPFNFYTPIQRLRTMGKLIEEKQILLSNGLQIFIENIFQEDKAAEKLIANEIKYLKTVSSSALSSEVAKSNQAYQIIDIEKMKSQSDKESKKLQEALDRYNDRCSKEKGNQPKTPASPTENTTMPELKNDSLEEQEKNKTTDSENDSDDDSASHQSFYSAVDDWDEATIDDLAISSQPTVCIEKYHEQTVRTEQPHDPSIHAENQQQNTSNKNNLLTKLWDLLVKVWQYIQNSFKYFKKNAGLKHADIIEPSHPAPPQNSFEEKIPPLITAIKKPQPTPVSVTNAPQTLFANKGTARMSAQRMNRTAEWITTHLPKFGML